MKILLDTSVLISLQVDTEATHKKVQKYLAEQQKLGSKFLVTDYVLDELFTRILYDFGAKAAKLCTKTIAKELENGSLHLFPISSDLFNRAQDIFVEMATRKLSFTDASTLAVYRHYKIDEICTLDGGFHKAGAVVSYLD